MTFARRADTTQPDIIDTLQSLGFCVANTSSCGRGFPDLVIYRENVGTYLAECKNGILGWKYTPHQDRFHKRWRGPIALFEDVDSVIAWEKRLRGTV